MSIPDSVRHEWLRRVEAEYRSSAISQELTLWLTRIGASPDLIHEGLRIADDEIVHAELSFAAYVAAGGSEGPRLERETLGIGAPIDQHPLEVHVLRTVVDVFCLGETVAVPLFRELRQHATVPEARTLLDRVLVDEVRHRDFGWLALGWMLVQPDSATYLTIVNAELPAFFARIKRAYGGITSDYEVSEVERAWGLMSPKRYGEILHRTFERDYEPRFQKLGIDANAAWAQASI